MAARTVVSKALYFVLALGLIVAGALSGQWLAAFGVVGSMVLIEALGRVQDSGAHRAAESEPERQDRDSARQPSA